MDQIKDNVFERSTKVFNSPIELALRSMLIIHEEGEGGIDLDRLIYYDYFITNTSDIGDLESIHPPLPFRGSQVLVKREIIQDGLNILLVKELINMNFHESGIRYCSNALTEPFVSYFTSGYFNKLRERVKWVSNRFKSFSDVQLKDYVNENLSKWGAEFIKESLFREDL